ncbi:MAG: proton-conducting transporter membrane subunit [Polyangiaceae bacterium]
MNPLVHLFVTLLGPLSLIGVAVAARGEPGQAPRRVQRYLVRATMLGVLAALSAWIAVGAQGQLTSPRLGYAGLGAAIRLDALSATIFSMVVLLVLVIARFSVTYLDGDPRHGTFLGRLAATAAAVEVLVIANNLLLLWVAWVATSLCLHRLLVFYPDRPRAVLAARKKFIVARLGDACLGGALLTLYGRTGTSDLSRILADSSAHSGWALSTAGVLLALTALLKSAQFPTHGWLVEVMETPTPVSALLHAGILNAGPFLILRFSPLLDAAPGSAWPLLVGGGFTALFASVALRTQPSVKVALGYSSAAHMGFMLFVCGLGVYAAAALHLVAHSFYKAHAFLSAGSTVDVNQAKRVAVHQREPSAGRAALALALATGLYLGLAHALGVSPWDQPSLWLVGAVFVLGMMQLVGAGLGAPFKPRVYLRVLAAAGGVTIAFFGLEALAHAFLADSLPAYAQTRPAQLILAGVVVSVWALASVLQLSGLGRHTGFAERLRVHFKHGFYANALFDRLVCHSNPRLPSGGLS